MVGVEPSRLIDFLARIAQLDAEFIVYDDGYRGWTYRFADVAKAAHALRVRIRTLGVRKGDAAVIWSESRPGWVAALWGCLLEGVVVVPVDPQSSLALFRRIQQKVQARVVLSGENVPSIEQNGVPVWRLSDLEQARDDTPLEPVAIASDDVAEIVFTSGTTTEPKGVVIAHGNLLANLKPVETEIAKYRKHARPFMPLRILNLLPLSHLFGQSLSLFLPPLVPASVSSYREPARRKSCGRFEPGEYPRSWPSPRFWKFCETSWCIVFLRSPIREQDAAHGPFAGGASARSTGC
jgi:long-chain acyl-CoA synthetase